MKLFRLFLAPVLWMALVTPMHGLVLESSETDESLKEFNKQLWQRDFSSLWTVRQLPAFDENMNHKRPEPIGYMGPYFQRFYIHFLDVYQSKETPAQYQVKGKTKFKDRICDLTGTLTIQSIKCGPERQFGKGEYLTVTDEILGDRRLRFGTIKGIYVLKEDPQKAQSGVLRGTFVVDFLIDEQGEILYDNLEAYSDSYCNNQFEGTWAYHSRDGYRGVRQDSMVCNWGDYRIPCSLGLDIGAAEFSPSDEFSPYGWKTYWTAKEEKEWWK